MNQVTLTAFISCYNEEQFIAQTLDDVIHALKISVPSYEVIIIDDCSSDQSAKKIISYIQENSEVPIIFRKNLINKGLAQNYIDAAFMGKGEFYKLFCGDNTEPIESIIKICNNIGLADMIIPYYDIVYGKPKSRMLLSNSYTKLINLISGNHIKYYNGLQVHKRYNIMRWHPNTRGFGFQADILCLLLQNKQTYVEVAVPAIDNTPSKALTVKNILSIGHTMIDILIRRLANLIYPIA